MANLSLPSSPTDGQVVTHENTKFVYNQSKDVWTRETLADRIENVVPTTNESISSTGIIGSNLVFTKADGTTSNVSLQALAGGAVTVYTSESDLPSSAQNGDHAFVTTTDDLYIRSSGAWRVIDAINLSPTITASLSTKSFAAAETIDITYTTSEPEGTPVTVTTSNTGISNTGQVTITHHTSNNTVTVLAGDQALSGGTLILSVTDGTNIGTGTITLDVVVAPDWSNTPTLSNVIIEPTQVKNSAFGIDIAMVGNTAVVGTGSVREGAYVYSKSGSSWSYVATLLPSDTATGDNFGQQVLITPDESTIIVSAPAQDGNATYAGKVYTFTLVGGTWSQTSAFQAPGTVTSYEEFGRLLAISPDGNTLAISQPGWDNGGVVNTGRILIYTGSGSSWTYRTSILPTDVVNYESIGRAGSGMALSNSTLVFGSIYHAWGTAAAHGAAYVWTGSGASWSQQAKLDFTNRLTQTSDKAFGSDVSINGDTIAVGAVGDDDTNTNENTGAVYVYTRSGTTWSQQARLQHTGAGAGHGIGFKVLLNPDDIDILYVGAATTLGGVAQAGSVIVFQRSGSSWSQINSFDNPGYNGNAPVFQSQFGHISVSGANFMISAWMAPAHPTQPTWGTGVVYFYGI
jgi:hypothetical protein